MKLEFLFVGKTSEKYLEEGIQIYLKRLKHYASVTISVVASLSTGNKDAVIKKESELILKKIENFRRPSI